MQQERNALNLLKVINKSTGIILNEDIYMTILQISDKVRKPIIRNPFIVGKMV